ncbi:hypothetical protein ACRQFN_02380 [Actinotignum sp. GS-2025e]|uniref:hypothetical protein n=1 Tax=unclassified Actinotignum TaxID=2632702 RepID=UPI003F48BCC6
MTKRKNNRISPATMPALRDSFIEAFLSGQSIAKAINQEKLYAGAVRNFALPFYQAELWWVTKPMTALTASAIETFPEGVNISEYLPNTSGLLMWAGDIGISDGNTRVRGALWMVVPDGLYVYPVVTDPAGPFGLATPLQPPSASTLGKLKEALIATWVLSSQPGIGVKREEYNTVGRSSLRRLKLPKKVTIATLRELTHEETGEPVDGDRHYSVRFLVRGHWRNQVCGPARKMRRLTWVAPFVKGPDGAPFQKTDLVKVWKR